MSISFSDIPGHQNLFLDYLYEYDSVNSYYYRDFRNKEEYLKLFKNLSLSKRNRDIVPSVIESQYENFTPSDGTKKNIALLKESKTFAVVTGQQLGILGGPLYTIYKIITAIKLSRHLSERYDDYSFVPVFWLEGDDHDFEEVSYLNLISDNNDLLKIKYDDNVPGEENRGNIGFLKFTSALDAFFNELDGSLRDTDFKPQIMEKLKSFYKEGRTFKEAFKDLIFWLFDGYGLVIFDPQDARLKEFLKPVFKKEISDFRQHTEKLVNSSAILEEVYHAQVKVRPVNLFYSMEGGRYLIEPVENEFRLKGKRKKFTKDELLDLIEKEPQNFSPNVLLRPICQDYMLPTAFYVGGPSEIAYFAQVNPLYPIFNIEPPIIYPRSSATIIEKNISTVLDKYNIEITELLSNPERVKEKIVSALSDTPLEKSFEDAIYQVELVYDRLKEVLFDIDKTLSDAGNKYKQNSLNYLDQLKGKAFDAQKKKYETTLRQVDRLGVHLNPNGNLQEREINWIYYANKYGVDFISKLYDGLEINNFEHQLIYL